MQLLLFSNSTNSGEPYMEHTLPYISSFLKNAGSNAVFIPYAGITPGYDNYFDLVRDRLSTLSVKLTSIHKVKNKLRLLQDSEIIIAGGGNTFYLLKSLQDEGLLGPISDCVKNGKYYIGWSAGANLACPTIRTTNDMPVVQPRNFDALNLIPFQINPHYTDYHPPGHAGETRETRINEFTLVNQNIYVAGLREGSLFHINGTNIDLIGPRPCKIFHYGKPALEVNPGENLNFLMQ